MILGLELVEQAFGRFVSEALGQPPRSNGFPLDRESAATLLILREFMHHLQRFAAAWRTRMGEAALAWLAPKPGLARQFSATHRCGMQANVEEMPACGRAPLFV